MKKILIKNKDGELLSGIIEGNSKNLIILCHGSRGNKNSSILKYISNNLKNKYSLFRFDFSGNGESKGLLENSTYLKDVSDLNSVVDYFLKKNYKILSIIGHSKGGSDVFLYASKYPFKSKSIIAFAPRFNLLESQEYYHFKKNKKDFLKNGHYIYKSKSSKQKITKEYIKEIEKLGDIGKNIFLKVPVLILHGDSDKIISSKDSKNILKNNKNIELKILKNENHCFKKSIKTKHVFRILKNWLSNWI